VIKIKNKKIFIITTIFLYLIVTLPAIFDTNHVMKNLEPYPDGILFSLSARNLSLGQGLSLITNWGEVPFWVPPLYSWYLAIFYFISSNVTSFYFANLLLGLGTIFNIYLSIKKTTKNLIPLIIGLSTYFSHLVIFWLPSLAMTENLSLFLFSLLILGLIEVKNKQKVLLIVLSSLGLLLVRLSVFPIILVAFLLAIFQLRDKLSKYLKQIIFSSLIIIFVSFYLSKIEISKTIISTISNSIFDPIFFSIDFIYDNFINYFNLLFFHKGQFLWMQVGVTSWPILGLFLYSVYLLDKLKKIKKSRLLITLFLSLFPLQIIFYIVDARYLIYIIILVSISGAWLVNEVKNKKIIIVFFIAIILNIFLQKNLLKQLIADNWLGRSTAWQYEAILHLNKNLSEDEMIVTALPPFLIDAYQTKNYQMLPLSKSQEFLQKGQFVWGTNIDYDDLIKNYNNWLEEGKTLYISNAYITHQQLVINDFEKFKNNFELKLISEGCLEACNIYKLKLKE
jgi:hypothetical protein